MPPSVHSAYGPSCTPWTNLDKRTRVPFSAHSSLEPCCLPLSSTKYRSLTAPLGQSSVRSSGLGGSWHHAGAPQTVARRTARHQPDRLVRRWSGHLSREVPVGMARPRLTLAAWGVASC